MSTQSGLNHMILTCVTEILLHGKLTEQ